MRHVFIPILIALAACTDVSGLGDPWGGAQVQGKGYPTFMDSADLYAQTQTGAAPDISDLQARAKRRPILANLDAENQAAYVRDMRLRAGAVRAPVLTPAERARLMTRISR
ncbi:MAG: hypothetical protein ACWA40_02340 [Planktomarina sp.]